MISKSITSGHILKLMSWLLIPLLILVSIVVVNLIILSSQVAGYQAYWSENNLKPATDGAITYVALGDSSAQSIGASSPDNGYVGLIAKSISEKTNKPVRIINLSKSGAKVGNVISEQLPKLAEYDIPQSAIYTIQIGANDSVRDFDIDGFENDMKKLLNLLPPRTVISDLPSFKSTRFSAADENAKNANKRFYRLVKSYDLTIAPLYEVTSSRASWRNNAIDIFHPNNRGYKNWHDAFWPSIESML